MTWGGVIFLVVVFLGIVVGSYIIARALTDG